MYKKTKYDSSTKSGDMRDRIISSDWLRIMIRTTFKKHASVIKTSSKKHHFWAILGPIFQKPMTVI